MRDNYEIACDHGALSGCGTLDEETNNAMNEARKVEAIAFAEWLDTIEPTDPITETCRDIPSYYKTWETNKKYQK